MGAFGGMDVNVKKGAEFFFFCTKLFDWVQNFPQYLLCIPAFRLKECLAV